MPPEPTRLQVGPPGGPDPTPAFDAPPMTATKKRKGKKASSTRSMVEWVLVIAGAVVLALIIRTFLIAAFYIPSGSMLDTLHKNDRVLVNKLSYKLHDVRRGDVVVFERPPNEPDTSINDLIKRVMGLPGDT